MNSGSVDSLNVCDRCGASANARQIREIADCDMPVAAAIDLVDQWVAFLGFSSSVLTMTRSTSASVIFRGTPGRGSSDRPSRPRSRNRLRQVRTVSGETHSRRDTSMIECPSAHSSTIRDRWARAWAVVRRRTQPSSTARWASVTDNGGIFGPGRLMPNQRRISDSGH
ncbi:hypothetical protein SGLAU_10400 [Streptomyces glaucescens]|uniref:Uncharacterized protein n=1 Tax=Streptomyces glaucescens TaxID=1907 RepID=A0A089X2Q1_STRGA|nr:hypothetical protein SGLAU_10400 [Streptomyces glaucescens]